MGNTKSDATGQRLIEVLTRAYQAPFALQSGFARSSAFAIAVAASLGFITSQTSPRSTTFSNTWRITEAGLRHLEKSK